MIKYEVGSKTGKLKYEMGPKTGSKSKRLNTKRPKNGLKIKKPKYELGL